MNIENLIEAVKLCGSTPKIDQCKKCAYYAGGDMSKCIPVMTSDAAAALSALKIDLKAITNADHIRSMSDEELAKEMKRRAIYSICDIVCGGDCKARATLNKTSLEVCGEIIFTWLQQPYEEEAQHD